MACGHTCRFLTSLPHVLAAVTNNGGAIRLLGAEMRMSSAGVIVDATVDVFFAGLRDARPEPVQAHDGLADGAERHLLGFD